MNIVVIGGGIIGTSCAAFLAERGATVTVVDGDKPRFGTSIGNAGHIVVSHSIPFAAPGMVKSGLRSLLTQDGAFALSNRPGQGTLDWLIGFARRCTEANVATFHPGLEAVLRRSAELLLSDGALEINARGLWQVFTGAGAGERAEREAGHMQTHGVRVRDIDEAELRAEPGLTDNVNAAIELTDDLGLDPAHLWMRMRQRGEDAGARWMTGVVTDVRSSPTVRTADGDLTLDADAVILAAGAWSPAVARSLDVDLPIRAAKGYSVTLPRTDTAPTRPMLLMDQRTAVNPLSDGLRLSARYEITSPDDRDIAQHRIPALIDRARIAIALPTAPESVQPWTGVRPATIDGAPYIGRLPQRGAQPVFVATGHGMIGTAMAAGTADLVTRLVYAEQISDAEARLGPQRLFA
ncbi:MAG: FAD-dependent oxidoreductase [Actinomycetota bacterium]|nr:FAD-dependent oxidoreductase [Actinomycetota bacterium]